MSIIYENKSVVLGNVQRLFENNITVVLIRGVAIIMILFYVLLTIQQEISFSKFGPLSDRRSWLNNTTLKYACGPVVSKVVRAPGENEFQTGKENKINNNNTDYK